MTPTEELCKRLDERGVEWDKFSVSNTEYIHWTNKDGHWCAASIGGPLSLHINILSATPEQAISATVGETVCEPSKEWKAWHESLKHDNPSNVREAVENILFDAIDFGSNMGPNGNVWSGVDEGDVLTEKFIDEWVGSIESVAATVGGTCHFSVQDNIAETDGMGDVWLECDECHWQMPLEPSTPRFKFCPNCGRRVAE